MSLHLHCPHCGELLIEEATTVTTSAREGTRQETYDLACLCGTRLRLQLPPQRLAPPRRRRRLARHRGGPAREARRASAPVAAEEAPSVRPTADRPFPFTPWQYARLLVLRGRVRDGEISEGEPLDGNQPQATKSD
ncbi:MAG TPA: hypothetical protein VKZ60_20155 [Chloroflexota bacterium]|nr:hypothetical protein [Chloroflexota bacterium]